MRAKKHLGQHFLTSKKFIDDVIRVAEIGKDDVVVEIGPGKGALTKGLLQKAEQVVAIEKDDDLTQKLKKTFAEEVEQKRFTLIAGDALSVDIDEYTKKPYLLVANIPYYITGRIIRHFLSRKQQPISMTLIMQKEVAERLVCRDGKESLLSLSVKAYGRARFIEKIPARYFSPKPQVDSAIVHISNISRIFFEDVDEKLFFTFLKAGFEHKRKKMINNLETLYPKDVLRKAFTSCGVSESSRAEELSLEMWKRLFLCVTN